MRKGAFLVGFLLSLLTIAIFFAASSFLVSSSWAWSNGGYSDDPANPDYGTHDWIAEHALDWLRAEEKQYILDNLAVYLYGTELPDNGGAPDGIGDTTNHHIYYNSTEVMTDDAAATRASTEYSNALSFLEAKDYVNAAKTAGIMSHYIVDVGVFGHVMGAGTDWGAEVHHSDYETYVNDRTSSYTAEFNSYLSFDSSLQTISAYDAATSLAYDTTFDVDGPLNCTWMDQNYDWNNPIFKNRAGESLNLAVNYLADVLHTLYRAAIPDQAYIPVPYHYQINSYYCGPAALEMVFDYYGPDIPQTEIADVARTLADGTYTSDMVRAAQFSNLSTSVGAAMPESITGYTAREFGYAALENRGTTMDELKYLIAAGYPIIVLTTWHFRVAVGYTSTHIIFQDSLNGRNYSMTYALFDTSWDYSGHWALLVSPWRIQVSAPSKVPRGSNFNVTARIVYPAPYPFHQNVYPASSSNVTILLPHGLSLAQAETPTKIINTGILVAGGSATIRWDVAAEEVGTQILGVEAFGKISGFASDLPYNRYSYFYTDRIGGVTSAAVEVLEQGPNTIDDYDGTWHTTDFTITLTATDAFNNIVDTYYKLNNDPMKTVSVDGQPLITTEAVNNTLEYWSIDDAGYQEDVHILTNIKLDKTIPTGSISINNGDTYTTSRTITLTLTAVDTLSGAHQVRYSNSSLWTTERWETPSPTKTLTLPLSDGAKTIYYQVKDNAGLISTTYSDTIIMDTTSPTGSIKINEGAAYTTTNTVTIYTTSADATSGVAQIRFSNDKTTWTPWETYSTTKSWAVTANDGLKTVCYQIRDNAGLVSIIYSDTIILDATPPTGSIAINEGAAYATTFTVTLTLSSEDFTSGVAQMRFSHDEITWSDWEACSPTRIWLLTTNDGTKTVYYQIKDSAGLISPTYSDMIILDTVPPAVSVTSHASGFRTELSTLAVAWVGSDETSGIDYYEIRLDNEPWNKVGIDTSYILTDLSDGAHTLEVKAIDRVGNESQDSISFVVSATPVPRPVNIEIAIIAILVVVTLAIMTYVIGKRSKK